jgi:hypothetical protein
MPSNCPRGGSIAAGADAGSWSRLTASRGMGLPNNPPCGLAAAVSLGFSAGVDFGAGFSSRGIALATGAGSGLGDAASAAAAAVVSLTSVLGASGAFSASGRASLAGEAATCAGSGRAAGFGSSGSVSTFASSRSLRRARRAPNHRLDRFLRVVATLAGSGRARASVRLQPSEDTGAATVSGSPGDLRRLLLRRVSIRQAASRPSARQPPARFCRRFSAGAAFAGEAGAGSTA